MILPHTHEAGDPYYIGDVYEESTVRLELSWRNEALPAAPYLHHIDQLTDNGWPQLRYLADWMRVTTAPPKWKFLGKEDMHERATRVNIILLEFRTEVNTRHDITTIEHLRRLLPQLSADSDDVVARLFVVEDLSRDVIETLGSHLDIDPMFFRGHLSDYNWYNTSDPWIELPPMNLTLRHQSFFHVRYAHARYFRNWRSCERARFETGGFNVLRRLDHDASWMSGFDDPHSITGMVRSRMSFWVQPRKPGDVATTSGVLLIDPSVSEGFPLWGGSNDFIPCPSIAEGPCRRPPKLSAFEHVVYLIERLSTEDIESLAKDPRRLFQEPLCIVCSEWLTLIRYANTRLSQLEWEVEDPYLRRRYKDLSATLDKIHSWRRRFPIYKTMASEALSQVIRRDQFLQATENSLLALEKDFEVILAELEDLHERAERIMSVVTAVMSIEESKKALQQDRSLARLTYLAVTFVPLSFISSFFSMSDDITKLRQTFWIYFSVAIPVTLLALVVVRFSDPVADLYRRVIRRFKRMEGRRWTEKPEHVVPQRADGSRGSIWLTKKDRKLSRN
ncbi:MAG: hypothetical protein LQ346_008337 [Caloplaca aetnensis]|nr:MAG: hypothetical protein LQ346_008337 [Caloplaca aetnensis]